jgi:membrane-associated protein
MSPRIRSSQRVASGTVVAPGLLAVTPGGRGVSDLVAPCAAHGYWALGLVILLENAGVPVPGETALLAAGYLSSPDGGRCLRLWSVVGVGFAAAVIGDNVGYWLGRRFARPRLKAGRRFLLLTPDRMARVEEYFARYGTATVFFARFVALLRMVAGPAAGAVGMPWRRFVVANAAGAFVWVTTVAVLGQSFGHAWEALHRWLGWGAWAAAGAVILCIAAWRITLRLRSRAIRSTSGTGTLPVGESEPLLGTAGRSPEES